MPSSKARFVGVPVDKAHRSQVLLYRLDLGACDGSQDGELCLHLFAETRYRLWVNGAFISSGPARFVQSAPLFDSIDLTPFLGSGPNCIAVEVHHYGCSSFQTMPGGRDGFIAWGGRGSFDFSTPGSWNVRALDGWARDTALYTFALNAVEVRDTRCTEDAWYLPGVLGGGWEPARLLPEEEVAWGELAPRSVPYPLFERAEPRTLVLQESLADLGEVFGIHFPDRYLGPPRIIQGGKCLAIQFWVKSDRSQAIELWHHWGVYWINGDVFGSDTEEVAGLRMFSSVSLKRGWNCICGIVKCLPNTVYWDCFFRLPRGLRARAFPIADCRDRLRVSPLLDERLQNEWIVAGQLVENADWIVAGGDPWKLTPARLMAWQKLRMEFGGDSKLDGGMVWVFDFGREVLGHVELVVDAEPGQIVDVGYDEWQQPSGMIDLYRTNPFVHTVDRYVLRGGVQKITGLNPRGGHFVQVVMYPSAGAGKNATLNSLKVIETRTLKAAKGTFSDGNPVDEAIWKASLATVIGSAEDVYSDSPWRERGAYIGDFTVNQLLQGLIDADLRIARRCLQLFAQSQLDNGQFACVAPSHHQTPHEDFSLIWVLGLWEHWGMTGDHAFVEDMWPHLLRLWDSSVWLEGATGLWGADGMRLFIDWGVRLEDRQGSANGVLNALRIFALEKSESLARELGRVDEAEAFRKEALRVREAFATSLWIAAEGRYAACIDNEGTLSTSSAAHSNLLAWNLEIGSPKQVSSVQKYLFEFLEGNHDLGLGEGGFSGHVELYFFRYLLSAMAERGHGERALRLIRQHWGPLVADRFGTLPECFYRFEDRMGSRCHGWSGYPAVWYMNWILGLRQESAGDPNNWILDPLEIEGINKVDGALPHRSGLIRVAWHRQLDGELEVSINSPEGVSVRLVDPTASVVSSV